MFLLVLHCTLYLLVFVRGSRVIDAHNQAVQKNKYCSKVAECLPGTHVMCMYGNTEVMNPKCADGRILPLENTERDLFLDIFNGFRRDLASGKEVLGKDGVRLPQARNMKKLLWDNELATFAQAWANQCHVRRNQCHSTDHYPRAGQMVGIVRFSYPDWSVPNKKFEDLGLTLERRKFAIEDFAKTVFSARKSVTISMIQKHVGSGHGNVYLLSVYGSTSHIGCAMTTFVDYQMSFHSDNDYYNAMILVCNFGSRPQNDEPIYMTNGTGPCSCFQGFKIEDCLCVPGEDLNNREQTEKPDQTEENNQKLEKKEGKTEKPNQKEEGTRKPDEKEDQTEKPDLNDRTTEKSDQNTEKPNKDEKTEKPVQKEEEKDPDKNDEKGSCPVIAPVVVVLPIFDVHDAGLMETLHPFQNQNLTAIAERRQQFRCKIKERIQNAKNQYFCSHGEPVPNFFNVGSVDRNSFLTSEFDPDYKQSNGNRKERDLDLTIPRILHNIRMKPKLDISDMLRNHQNIIKGNSRTNVAHRLFNDMRNTAAAKIYVPPINGKPVIYPFENFQKTQRLHRPFPYAVQGFSNQEPNVFISSIHGKPVKFHYDDKFKKSLKPSTRNLSYEVEGFNYKELPHMAFSNDDYGKLISDLYAKDQELKDMLHNNYINEKVQKILGRTGDKIANKDNILITKQTRKSDLTNSIGSKLFAPDNIDPSIIGNEEKPVKSRITLPTVRNDIMYNNLNNTEGILHIQEANRIFNDIRNTADSKTYVKSVNDKSLKGPFENIQKSQRLNPKTLPYRAESEMYLTSINGEPKKFKHLQIPGTRTLSYDIRDQLLIGLFSQVQQLKEILYKSYVKENDQKRLRTTGEDIPNKDNILITKQIDDLTDNTGSKVFAANINGPSNIGNEQKTIEMEISDWRINNQNHNGVNSQTEETNQILNNMRNTAPTKIYVTFVNSNPVKHPFENSTKTPSLTTNNAPYGEPRNNHQEHKIDLTNSKPVKYQYDEKFKKTHNTSTKDLSYDVRSSIYKKTPNTTMSNNNRGQLLVDLYTEEQKLKDLLFKAYIGEMEQKNLPEIEKGNIKEIILKNKRKVNGSKGIDSKVFPTGNNNPSNIDNEQKTIKTQIDDSRKRNQVPLHIHAYGTDNFDYHRYFHATKEFSKPRAMLRNNKHENSKGNIKNASNGDNPGKNRLYDYDVDKLRSYYLDIFKDMH